MGSTVFIRTILNLIIIMMDFKDLIVQFIDRFDKLKERILKDAAKIDFNFKHLFSIKPILLVVVIAILFTLVFCRNEVELDQDAKILFIKTECVVCNANTKILAQKRVNTVHNDCVNITTKHESI